MRRAASVPDDGTTLALELPAAQFDFARALGFLRARAVPAIERFVPDGFDRVLRTGTE